MPTPPDMHQVATGRSPRKKQLELFEPLLATYSAAEGPVSNDALYDQLGRTQGLPDCHWSDKVPIGRSGALHSPERRRIRWFQQSLKALGLIERVPGQRGVWQATTALLKLKKEHEELTPAPVGMVFLGFSTELGLALWANNVDVFSALGEPIHCVLSSPPYPLSQPRAYGGPTVDVYVDFICTHLEPIVRLLAPGGTICINVTNDVFIRGMPARHLYREELVLAMCKRLGLYKLEEMIWVDPTKAPGPVAWASKKRVQLNVGWEPIYLFTNDPTRVFADNRRVLREHTPAQKRLIARGGESRTGTYGDGANRIRPGSFGLETQGAIPKNVLVYPHRCSSQIALRKRLRELGLPMHGATMPLPLAKFLVEFLTEPGQLVVDHYGGWLTSALAAEKSGRRWVATERMGEYLKGAQLRFLDAPGFESSIPIA